MRSWRRSQSSSAVTFVSTAGSSEPASIVCQMSSPRFFAPVTRHEPPESPTSCPCRPVAHPAGIEDGAIQEDGVRIGVDLDHGGFDLARVRIGVADVLTHTGKASAYVECRATGTLRRAGRLASLLTIEPIGGLGAPHTS